MPGADVTRFVTVMSMAGVMLPCTTFVLYYTVHCITTLHITVLHFNVLCNTTLHITVLHFNVLLHCTL